MVFCHERFCQKNGAKTPNFALESGDNYTFSPVELTISSVRGKVYTEDLNAFQRSWVVTVREFEAEWLWPGDWVSQCSATVKHDCNSYHTTLPCPYAAANDSNASVEWLQLCMCWHTETLAKTFPSGYNELVNIIQQWILSVLISFTLPPNVISLNKRQWRYKIPNWFFVENVIFTVKLLYSE